MLTWPLEDDETLLWQGRPAPRCFVFRNWRGIVAATVALVFSLFALRRLWAEGAAPGWQLLILIFGLSFLAFGPGRLIYRRWRWEALFYAVTERRVLVQDRHRALVRTYRLDQLSGCQIRNYSFRLASIQLFFQHQPPLVLECLEEPGACLRHLPAASRCGICHDPV